MSSGRNSDAAPVEREVKLGAPVELRLPDLGGVRPGVSVTPLPSQQLVATYYDTDDLRLARWGVTVRFRTEATSSEWTVKLPAPGGPTGGLARRELTFGGGEGELPEEVVRLVRGLTRAAPLGVVSRLRTDRLRLRLADADGLCLAEIDDDEVSVLPHEEDGQLIGSAGEGGPIVSRFREIEVELDGGDDRLLDAVVAQLRAAGAGAPDPTPKLVRAVGARALELPDVVVPAVGRRPSAAQVVHAAIAGSVRTIVLRDAGVRLGDDAEDVHQARVATRRLRSDLRTFRSLVDPDWAAGVRAELGWIAGLLGDVRDTDVLLARFRGQLRRLPPDDAAAAAVAVARLADHRDDARAVLLACLDSTRYAKLLDELVAAAADPPFMGRTVTGALRGPAGKPAERVLPALVRGPWRQLARDVAALGRRPPDEKLHAVRILAKRCRYAAEAVTPAVGGKARRFAEEVAAVQTVLGDLHDAVVAEAWLRDQAGRSSTDGALALGLLVQLERQAAARARTGWQEAWREASRPSHRAWFR